MSALPREQSKRARPKSFLSETLKLRIMNEPLSKLADKEICSVKSPSSSYTCKGGGHSAKN